MSKITYLKEPVEYDELIGLISSDIVEIGIMSKKVGFYDTCSIQFHSTFSNPKLLAEYFNDRFDLLLITRTVIMELSIEPNLVKSILEYIIFLLQEGVKVVLTLLENYINREELRALIKTL